VLPEQKDLSPSERLQLVDDLWDSLAATPDVIPFHDWQREVIEERKSNLQANPESALTWDEILRRVRSHLS
jgi:putative addiction module component (TIGR02574 family)